MWRKGRWVECARAAIVEAREVPTVGDETLHRVLHEAIENAGARLLPASLRTSAVPLAPDDVHRRLVYDGPRLAIGAAGGGVFLVEPKPATVPKYGDARVVGP